MEIKHHGIKIDENEPFKYCVLDRKQYAEHLTSFLEGYNKSFVLAINNPWGTGKSTFIKMWQKSLELNGFKTVFFNAWENDFTNDPLTAILGELKGLNGRHKIELKKVLTIASKFSSELLPVLLKGLAKQKFGEEAIDLIEAAAKGGTKIMEEYVDDYTEKKDSLQQFKSELEKSISKISPDKPIVFFVDELDRCRPNYSVEILEKIKHFFNIENIIFVLAIDKEQLGHAICGVYNSQNINSHEYLKRFIDIEYNIPSPNAHLYINYLANTNGLSQFFIKRGQLGAPAKELSDFKQFSHLLLGDCSLRTIEKIMGILLVSVISNKSYLINYPLHIFLVYLKIERLKDYDNFFKKKYSITDATEFFHNFYKEIKNQQLIQIEAQFIIAYANYLGGRTTRDEIYEQRICKYSSKIDKRGVDSLILGFDSEQLDIDMNNFFKRINITEHFAGI